MFDKIMDLGQKFVGNLIGTGSDSGALGLGQFRSTGYNIDRSAFDPNSQEAEFANYLQQLAMGTGGPSAAELQLRKGADLATNQAFALAASQRGVNPAMAARLALTGANQATQGANQDAGILRAQEQLNSQGLFGNLLESQRQARIAREQLEVQNQLGLDEINAGAYGAAAKQRSQFVKDASQGAMRAAMGGGMNRGGLVPGKAKVKGDSIKNDTVPVRLSPGELVVPRTVVEEGPEAIKSFAQAIMKKKEGKNGKKAA